jgi:hypothetical protein
LADLDNNGALDLIAGDQIFSVREKDSTRYLPTTGRSLVASRIKARMVVWIGIALTNPQDCGPIYQSWIQKNYSWQEIRTRAATVMGDQRINPFGIGGEIEIRSGLLTQKQMITSPLLHFGLGGPFRC